METVDFSPRGIARVAANLGYRRGPLEKVLRLVSVLEEIARDPYLQARVALKGGTALNLFLGTPTRLSIDADLDYVGAIDRVRMLKERPRVLSRLQEVGASMGYRVAIARQPHALAELQYRYDSTTGSDDLLKVELNFVNRMSILDVIEHRKCTLEIPGERGTVPCLSANEVAGLKLGTLCVRGAPRDLFDVAQYGRLSLDRKIVRKVALFRGFLESLDLSKFDPGLGARITQKNLNDQVDALLLAGGRTTTKDLLEVAAGWTGPLLPLGDQEEMFRERLGAGSFEPEKLFGKVSTHPRLREHPGMLLRLGRTPGN